MILNFLFITLLWVFIIDLSGFIETIEDGLSRWLKGRARVPKPFSCSLCMSWWTNLIYMLCVWDFTFPYVCIVALFAFLTPVFSIFLRWVRDVLEQMVYWLYKAFKME